MVIAGLIEKFTSVARKTWTISKSTELVLHQDPIMRYDEKVVAVIPAYNEEESIVSVLKGLLDQTRLPDEIHVVVNNTTDDTVYEASKLEGTHKLTKKLGLVACEIIVHDIGRAPGKKVQALNYGYNLAKKAGADYFLGVDGDTVLDRKALDHMIDEMEGDSRVGGLSAIYGFDDIKGGGPLSQFLLSAQKAQFVSFNLDNLLKNRTMSVIGGQGSVFRMKSLDAVSEQFLQNSPWVMDSEVEDSLLSIQIKKVGYQTKISARARANVGPMLSLSSLHAQQLKWSAGGAKLLTQFPFHANMRQKWGENLGMAMNILVRVMFAVLLAASLSLGSFVFSPFWLIPPVLAWILNMRITATMHSRTWKDWVYSVTFIGPELYMWLKSVFFIRSWWQVLGGADHDNWGLQSKAESGRGGISWLTWPLLSISAVGGIIVYAWLQLGIAEQTAIVGYGWPVLMVLTIMLTVGMLRKAIRPHRGYTA